jgi:hypothetical protein
MVASVGGYNQGMVASVGRQIHAMRDVDGPHSRSRRLGDPKPATVAADDHGTPAAVESVAVDTLREEWVVEDRWWTGRPLRRRYFELVLVDGRNVVVFRDLVGGGWFLQRA